MNLFGLLGISQRINIVASLPITRWSQIADKEDAHHRTESVVGIQDLGIGARYILSNSYFGPGTRIFAGVNLLIPTGASYETNPFSEGADTTEHRHFALGAGAMRVMITSEWWSRSEFPWVLGVTSLFSPRWLTSDLGFEPGLKLGFDLHAIGQSYRIWRGFPYLILRFRWEGADHWDGNPAPNSGGFFLDGSAGLDLELTEQISGVVRLHAPLWVKADGAQQSFYGIDLTFRFIKL